MTSASKTVITSSGAKVEISLTRDVVYDISYADGWNINLGRKVLKNTSITVVMPDGRRESGTSLTKVSNATQRGRDIIAKGGYARLGNVYVGKDTYGAIVAALAELDVEVGKTEEFLALEQADAERKARAKEDERRIDAERAERESQPGWCKRCQDWTYGDCGH